MNPNWEEYFSLEPLQIGLKMMVKNPCPELTTTISLLATHRMSSRRPRGDGSADLVVDHSICFALLWFNSVLSLSLEKAGSEISAEYREIYCVTSCFQYSINLPPNNHGHFIRLPPCLLMSLAKVNGLERISEFLRMLWLSEYSITSRQAYELCKSQRHPTLHPYSPS